MDGSREPDGLFSRLRQIPLFAELGDEASELLAFECRLAEGRVDLPEGSTPRLAYVAAIQQRAGDVVHSQDDLCADFCVVLSGAVQVSRTHPLEGSRLLDSCLAGDWFGEVTALSTRPSLTTNRVVEDGELLVLDARLFVRLYQEDEGFQERIDERYRRRSLELHLRTAPLFADVSPESLRSLLDECRFQTFAAGEVMAAQGDAVDTFALVRSGGVECRRREKDGSSSVLWYAMAHSLFGDQALHTPHSHWPGDCTALLRTDVVSIPAQVFRELLESRPGSLPAARHDAQAAEFMVSSQAYKGGRALVIDPHKCVRCNLCVESCASVHRDGVPRISKIGAKVETDDVLVTACYHCEVPSCMQSCAFGAIRRDEKGVVRFVLDNCVGCTECVKACPYDVIKMAELAAQREALNTEPPSLVSRLLGMVCGRPAAAMGTGGGESGAVLSELVINIGPEDEREEIVGGKALKCDLCAGLPFEACVYNCPTRAIERQGPEELFPRGVQ